MRDRTPFFSRGVLRELGDCRLGDGWGGYKIYDQGLAAEDKLTRVASQLGGLSPETKGEGCTTHAGENGSTSW
jgi:hypothetical protein